MRFPDEPETCFGYRFLVTNRNVFEGHENTPILTLDYQGNILSLMMDYAGGHIKTNSSMF